jgi:hypothetical protein
MTQIQEYLSSHKKDRCSEMLESERELNAVDEEPWRGWKGRRSTNERNVLLPYKMEGQPLAMRTPAVT